MKKKHIHIALLSSLLAHKAFAGYSLFAGYGPSSKGSLKTEQAEIEVDSVPMNFGINYDEPASATNKIAYNIGLSASLNETTYFISGAKKTGVNALYGIYLGLQIISKQAMRLYVGADLYPYANLAMASLTTSTINEETFQSSNLSILEGHATKPKLMITFEYDKRPFSKKNNMQFGIAGSVLNETFTLKKDRIITSKSHYTQSSKVNYTLSLTEITLVMMFVHH